MNRRDLFKSGAFALSAVVTGTPVAKADSKKAVFVLVHGSWHGAWCFNLLLPYLAAAGHIVVAKDLPGHGLSAKLPKSYLKRLLDQAAFATEASPVKDVTLDNYVNSVVKTIDEFTANGTENIILVGHSMGGLPVTLAGERAAKKIKKLIYLTAFMPPNGASGGSFLNIPEEQSAKVLSLLKASPETVGALRIDPSSEDLDYIANVNAAFYGDVSDEISAGARRLLTPDDPASPFQTPMVLTKERWGSIARAYIMCEMDFAIRPAVQRKFIELADRFVPENKTEVKSMDTSHSPFFSAPAQLAKILIELAS